MNKVLNFVKNQVAPGASCVAMMQYGLNHLPSQVTLLVGRAFNALPCLGGFTPAISGGVFFITTRLSDVVAKAILEYFVFGKTNLFNTKEFLANQALSGVITVITGSVYAAIYAYATGTAIVPFVVSVAALAALAWATTKAADATIYGILELVKLIRSRFNSDSPLDFIPKDYLLAIINVDTNKLTLEKMLEVTNNLLNSGEKQFYIDTLNKLYTLNDKIPGEEENLEAKTIKEQLEEAKIKIENQILEKTKK